MGLAPQRQVGPLGVWFSAPALLQVHLPTGRAPHEQVGPVTEFSWGARSQVQCWADCLPQVQVACWAGGCVSIGPYYPPNERGERRSVGLPQTQVSAVPWRQQVEAAVIVAVGVEEA